MMRTSNYPSATKIERKSVQANDIKAAGLNYEHPIFWWSIKVVCGAILIGSLFLMVIYQVPGLFSVPVIFAQALVLLGASTALWHYRILKRNGCDISVPRRLICNGGLYPRLRHPMYFADMMAYTGLFLLMPNVLTVLALALAYCALLRQAQVEDVYLASRFPQEFQQWKQSSRLIIPLVY